MAMPYAQPIVVIPCSIGKLVWFPPIFPAQMGYWQRDRFPPYYSGGSPPPHPCGGPPDDGSPGNGRYGSC